ncbi:hypothetical protein [Streptomyces cinnamoneus]|uniref:hypothetical protein n=1 Tax=Streptomyces cinnamoneus TaxID=53446 RepID=UPI001EFEEDE6|nr:hypothetical protein [Streptomyces cinnamoneus]
MVASFFTTDDAPGRAKRLAGLLDCYANGLDIAHPVTHVVDALARAGLKGTRAVSIGPSVWQGWDRWIAHVSEPDGWPRNFLRVHEEGVLDYYVVTATRPAPEQLLRQGAARRGAKRVGLRSVMTSEGSARPRAVSP